MRDSHVSTLSRIHFTYPTVLVMEIEPRLWLALYKPTLTAEWVWWGRSLLSI